MAAKIRIYWCIAVLTAWGASVSAQPAPSWNLAILPSLGGTYGEANAINNAGTIVGGSSTAGNAATHATLWRVGTAVDLGTLGGTASVAWDVNIGGLIVGSADFWPNRRRPVAWLGGTGFLLPQPGAEEGSAWGVSDTGVIVGSTAAEVGGSVWSRPVSWADVGAAAVDLGTLGGPHGGALAINGTGQIGGGSANATHFGSRATLWDRGSIIGLATNALGYSSTVRGLNDSGFAVGYEESQDFGYWRAMSWAQGVATILPDLWADTRESFAHAVNQAGAVVGRASDGAQQVAVLWYEGQVFDLNTLLSERQRAEGWVLMSANDINDSGVIVGRAFRWDGSATSAAFVLTPVPEPDTWAMLLAGLALVSVLARRSRVAR